ncbi:hypothetical protein RIF29_27667 [Crotalaria pallida]|uniref:Uncharacterized protein n=1 Tax=Crotalaria pallida TaxID=3830 RepID=A0AAN9EQF1_CROPI
MLSIFKQSIEDPGNTLSSWSTEQDCCKWSGVHCNNITGRVTSLQLQDYYLRGEFNFSLLDLKFLTYLDLRWNEFEFIDFESILASSENQNSHKVKFSNLIYLDLSYNFDLQMDNLRWVPHLSSLKYLSLSGIDLSNATLWLQRVTMLPSLMELQLHDCSLNGISSSLWYVNFTSLTLLDISSNNINSEMPKWLSNISHVVSHLDFSHNKLRGQIPATLLNFQQLKYLNLGDNHLNGSIPKWIGQFKYLEHLDLSNNMLYGPIPATIGNLSSLTYLHVDSNRLNGSLPMDLWQLSKLEILGIGYNSISGNLSEQSFTKLSNLKALTLDFSDFNFNFGTHWEPPFQLDEISMSNCKVGPEFPSWLYTQRKLYFLDISSSGLSFNGDSKFWSFVTQIEELDLSNNSISGDLSTTLITSRDIDLHSNKIGGFLPRLSPKVSFFNIANNSFSGPIYTLLCQNITEEHGLDTLVMSHNLLFGELPDCWMHWPSLMSVNLESNKM